MGNGEWRRIVEGIDGVKGGGGKDNVFRDGGVS